MLLIFACLWFLVGRMPRIDSYADDPREFHWARNLSLQNWIHNPLIRKIMDAVSMTPEQSVIAKAQPIERVAEKLSNQLRITPSEISNLAASSGDSIPTEQRTLAVPLDNTTAPGVNASTMDGIRVLSVPHPAPPVIAAGGGSGVPVNVGVGVGVGVPPLPFPFIPPPPPPPSRHGATPEPGTFQLVLGALIMALGIWRRRRWRKK